MKSYFLHSKDGRRPLQTTVLKALLPTDSEAPKLDHDNDKHDKIEKEANENNTKSAKKVSEKESAGNKKDEQNASPDMTENDLDNDANDQDDSGSVFEYGDGRRVSSVDSQYCGGFKNSSVCNII